MQEGGIEPDILGAAAFRCRLRRATRACAKPICARHLINEVKDGDEKIVESDDKPDPRFAATADELKKKGVIDFQLDYATKLLTRLAPGTPIQTAATEPATVAAPATQK